MQQFNRFEFKYLMLPACAHEIRERLLHVVGMRPDPATRGHREESYPVTSLYFDTHAMDDYHDKAGGFLRRKKIRVRMYALSLLSKSSNVIPGSQQPEIWLEKKEKYEMLISKKRILLSSDQYEDLPYGSRIALVSAHPLFLPLLIYGMKPVLLVRYMRRPLVSPWGHNFRITFDSGIEACKWREPNFLPSMTAVAKGKVVMEVKFSAALPYWFKRFLGEFHLSRQSFPKYTNSVEEVYRFHPIPR